MEQTSRQQIFPALFLMKTLIFSYIITGVLLSILAFLLYKTGLNEKMVSVAIIVIYVVATMCGGLLAGKKMQNRRFLWGLLMGCAYFLLLTIMSLWMGSGNLQEGNSFWTTLVLCAGGGMLGGMFS